MSRRGTAEEKTAKSDPIYRNRLVNMLVNRILKHGKKSLAYQIIYRAMKKIQQKTETIHYLFYVKQYVERKPLSGDSLILLLLRAVRGLQPFSIVVPLPMAVSYAFTHPSRHWKHHFPSDCMWLSMPPALHPDHVFFDTSSMTVIVHSYSFLS
ncbi:hypothetical protein C4D60_Mb00t11710 [Musa balbisiana]|uniref:Small ribosomal subunit protein uS7 domain-containing protein n=1 Tax=Musa balbisiana TaxID=52838 RepID=A0A4S8I5I8_MUSBA|nr:hypothetical protein C4D60_Mb00t11710 [Musa balbisiana]